MFFTRTAIFFLFIHTSYGWPPSNYSKSAATYGIGALDDEVDWSQHPCKRECKDLTPMTCRYGFTIENYSTMSKACFDCPFNITDCSRPHCLPGDGSNTRMVLVVNRLLPGPSIEVCKGDRIIVDVTNNLIGESTSIHWHGLHQRGTPFMDGTPMISQCPISSGDSFRYDFKADVSGSLFWHAHEGLQRPDGLFGALIVKTPISQNRLSHLYEHDEHVIILNDWTHYTGAESYLMQYQSGMPTNPHTILINGVGPWGDDPKSTLIPRPVFRVQKGSRHRFRIINAGGHVCTLYLSVDNHTLLVVSTDGADVEPLEVDVIRLSTGERYDFILNANREVDNYWIRVSGDVNCAPNKTHQEAILRYEGAPEIHPNLSTGYRVDFDDERLLNPFDRGTESKGALCVSCSLTSLYDDDVTLSTNPDYQFYLAYDFHHLNNPGYHREGLYEYEQFTQGEHDPRAQQSLQFNRIAYNRPKIPLQTQPEDIGRAHLCNVTETECHRHFCSCPNVLQVKLNSVVELVLVDEGIRNTELDQSMFWMNHPIHLHGFYYRVVAMEKLNRTTSVEQVKALDQAGKIHRRLKGAPWKDVLSVPSGGYAIIRFLADNPGYWFFHCHFDKHVHNGMAMIFKIGEDKDFPTVPKNFPKCLHHDRSDFLSQQNTSGAIKNQHLRMWYHLVALLFCLSKL